VLGALLLVEVRYFHWSFAVAVVDTVFAWLLSWAAHRVTALYRRWAGPPVVEERFSPPASDWPGDATPPRQPERVRFVG
jgi:hypothetical protein